MSYKSIMVCLDNSRHMPARLEFALALASEHGAHLTGLYLSQHFVPYISYDSVAMFIAEIEEQANTTQREVEQRFYEITRKTEASVDWLAFDSREVETAIVHARTADLLIAGQRNDEDDKTFVMEGFPETFLLGVGRPMLFLPYTYPSSSLPRFNTILVAWNGSREAARAVADALPLLAQAQNVIVLTVEHKDSHYVEDELPNIDLAVYLSRHGVKADVINTQNDHGRVGIGQAVLSKAIDHKADLIVMGAYGHSRLREWVLGGVTRTLLEKMTIPVLMSH